MSGPDLRDAPRILTEVLRQVTSLLQSEMRLARAEIGENLSRAGTGLVFYALALVLIIAGVNALATAGIAWMETRGLTLVEAAGGMGGGLLVLALICVLIARKRINARVLTPKRSLNNVKRDLETLQEVRRG
ncbi:MULTISPECIES: phage holin family protein [unclassified Mameliella]|uniref:phage holin family protein n=1 Tax=unclassified Mameliella TaxID=2630630 RepID=UPI00273FF565|nr:MULTISPECIES: phage holin family protein [unclassified Mameliella]